MIECGHCRRKSFVHCNVILFYSVLGLAFLRTLNTLSNVSELHFYKKGVL